MKREYLNELLTSGKDPKEIIDAIMASNGEDINNAKANYQVDPAKYVEADKFNALTAENQNLQTQYDSLKASTADYEDIKGKYNTLVEEKATTQRMDFLKSQKCKYPDLLAKEFDWGKVDFEKNEVDKDYMESVKTKYSGLFESKEEPYTPSLAGEPQSSFVDPQIENKLTNEQLQKL